MMHCCLGLCVLILIRSLTEMLCCLGGGHLPSHMVTKQQNEGLENNWFECVFMCGLRVNNMKYPKLLSLIMT